MSQPQSPWNVEIETFDPDDNREPDPGRPNIPSAHITIELGGSWDGNAETLAEELAAKRYIAGVICRTAITLHKEFDKTQRNHGCGRAWGARDVCHISTFEDAVAAADDMPFVAIDIPRDQVTQWEAKLSEVVDRILTADQYQPTADDEAKWMAEQEAHAKWLAEFEATPKPEPQPEPDEATPEPEPASPRLHVVREVVSEPEAPAEPDDAPRCRDCGTRLWSPLSIAERRCATCDDKAANQ